MATQRTRRTALLLALLPLSLAAAPTLRWVQADDLRVRQGPDAREVTTGVLQRGDEVELLDPNEVNGYCSIQGQGHHGYVACRYLSAVPVLRPRAGRDGLPADRRWVDGSGVLLRASGDGAAEVLGRLARRSWVSLRTEPAAADARYCPVQPLDRSGAAHGPAGFVACSLLSPESPRPASPLPADAGPAELAAAFWRQPGVWALEAYATALAKRLKPEGPWPADPELERMKEHLALGIKAPRPAPLPDWRTLKARADEADVRLLVQPLRNQARSGNDRGLWLRSLQTDRAAQLVQNALGLQGSLHDTISAEGGASRVLHLMRALEAPGIRPSLFRSEAEIAPGGDGPNELAGRFNGVVRTLIRPRSAPAPEGQEGAGLYDMRARTSQLARPVLRIQLLRDGRWTSSSTVVPVTEWLWREVDEPMCQGWRPGFAFGDADASVWQFFDDPGHGGAAFGAASRKQDEASRPRGSLFAYTALLPPPRARALVTEQAIPFDLASTGFAGATQWIFDLDHDDTPDLLVWEGLGPGPGHLESGTKGHHRWFRFALVNINGEWKVLGHDVFSYGCGC